MKKEITYIDVNGIKLTERVMSVEDLILTVHFITESGARVHYNPLQECYCEYSAH